MAQRMCDICGVRPAAIRVAVLQNNQERELDICDYHYAQLMRHQRTLSPLESLFQGGLLDDFMQGGGANTPRMGGRRGTPGTDAVNLQDHFSDQAKEILQRAAERAVQSGRQLVDTEDLLYELPESDVVQTLLKQFKISVDELRHQIETHAPKSEAPAQPREGGIGVSPRVKSALDRAFIASRELGHSYVGPEHILLGLAEIPDSFAGNLLQRYGLTPQALRQQTVKVVGKGAEKGHVDTPPTRRNSTNTVAT